MNVIPILYEKENNCFVLFSGLMPGIPPTGFHLGQRQCPQHHLSEIRKFMRLLGKKMAYAILLARYHT